MAQNWDRHCNTKGYGLNTDFQPNINEVEYKSGRTVRYLKNSRTIKEHAMRFRFDDSQKDPTKIIEGRTEYQWFLYWLEVTLRNLTESFYFTDIVQHTGVKEYKIKEWPTTNGQKWKYVNITFVEV